MTSDTDPGRQLTDRAKEILKIADEEAQRLKDAVVRGEHMLLGLLKEGSNVASNALKNMNVDVDSLKKALDQKIEERQTESSPGDPVNETADVLKAADKVAEELEHEHVGSEDLLLGILRNTKSVAGEVLENFGVQLENAREEVQRILGQNNSPDSPKTEPKREPTREPKRGEPTQDGGQIELSEKGRDANGQPISLDRRLFMQFTAFSGPADELISAFQSASIQGVVYSDINDSAGFGVMTFFEDPAYIVDTVQPLLGKLHEVEQKPEFTMLGRTYSIGYESNLEEALLHNPIKRVCDPNTPWAVYYPLRRSGMFEREPMDSQRKMLMEHGGIGRAFGKAGYATDIRLAAHGLNTEDHDFVIGLLGKELFPLSAVVQRMRRTRQTSEFIENMGPFFVGRAIWQPEMEKLNLV